MKKQRMEELLSRFGNLHIAVAGDLFLDRWYEIDPALDEPSVETGLTAWQVVRKRAAAGAAGTILNNLSALGVGRLTVLSMVGADGDGWEMRQLLQQAGVDTAHLHTSNAIVTPSYVKPLFPAEGNRLDIKNFAPTPRVLEDALIRSLETVLSGDCDALMLLDQVCEANTGVLTARVRNAVADMASRYPDKLIFADSRAYIHCYRNVCIKCNNYEAARMTGRAVAEGDFSPETVFAAMKDLRARTDHPVIVTCNRHGIAVEEKGHYHVVPAARQTGVIDVCGAGDASTAGMLSALAAGATFAEAAFMGNLTAGVTVRKIGCTGTASPAELRALYAEQWEGCP